MIKNAKWSELKFLTPIKEDEKLIFVTRSHPIIIISKIFAIGLLIFLVYIVNTILLDFSNQIFNSIMYVFDTTLLLFGVLMFHNYYISVQILTSERLIDIDQTSLIRREVNEVGVENIQNLNYEQRNVWQILFNMGDVIAETAGTNIDHRTNGFILENVYLPREVMNEVGKIWHEKNDQK